MITHVVVEARRHHHLARLVPIGDLSGGSTTTALRLGGTIADFALYPDVGETAFVRLGEWPPLEDRNWEVGLSTVLALPAFGTAGLEGGFYAAMPGSDGAYVTYDRIPVGEVELRRGSPVESADGRTVGHVAGVVLDGDGRISHLVLERGHMWGRRELTIPVAAVTRLTTDDVELQLTADQVAVLPATAIGRHGRRTRS
jgi:hypothetical protein